MSASMFINVSNTVEQGIEKKRAALNPVRIGTFIGERVTSLVKDHFLTLPHNKQGWAPVNFWAGAARATNYRVGPESVVISVNQQGVRQRFQGGTILPVNKKFLALPVSEEAYGEVPGKFGDSLRVIVIPGKGMFLALKNSEPRTKGEPEPEPTLYYRLVKKVTQAPNPNVLPPREQIAATAVEAVKEALE